MFNKLTWTTNQPIVVVCIPEEQKWGLIFYCDKQLILGKLVWSLTCNVMLISPEFKWLPWVNKKRYGDKISEGKNQGSEEIKCRNSKDRVIEGKVKIKLVQKL